MKIETHKPELVALIRERMKTGAFQSVEDMLMRALKSSPSEKDAQPPRHPKKNPAQFLLESPLRGSGLQLER